MWRDDPAWTRFWAGLPHSRWSSLREADAPYRGRLGWSSATLGAVFAALVDAPSAGKLALCAIAVGSLWQVVAADERSLQGELEHQADELVRLED